ncbi:MAG: 3-dehydroquinate dehydratase [Candidatus Actinomarina sp.]|nr:3-dehydroquinate dehydratase [Actinomycetota bacterium]MBL6832746.1 3-dehydroquinate dehydratase [Candidatus Actinomarina sp.]MBL6836460.1 3-dehydroquinate dehydratase [Candidatus Actinomarina sp.]MDB4823233.1 3-dehydroquinate dehydratase [Acidimicrobiia bacterium]
MKILIINGPNLNMLGLREINQYGKISYDDLCNLIKTHSKNKVQIEFYQSNIEGEIVSRVQEIIDQDIDALIVNPGAYTHTSIAIRDALAILNIPKIEVHLSDINSRENFRKTNLITDLCELSIIGKGANGYIEAIEYLYEKN